MTLYPGLSWCWSHVSPSVSLCSAYLWLRPWWLVSCSCCPAPPWCRWCTAYPASGPSGWETLSYPGLPPRLYGRPQTRRRLGKSLTWPEGVSTSAPAWFPSPQSLSVPWEHQALIFKESQTGVFITVFRDHEILLCFLQTCFHPFQLNKLNKKIVNRFVILLLKPLILLFCPPSVQSSHDSQTKWHYILATWNNLTNSSFYSQLSLKIGAVATIKHSFHSTHWFFFFVVVVLNMETLSTALAMLSKATDGCGKVRFYGNGCSGGNIKTKIQDAQDMKARRKQQFLLEYIL